MPLPSPMNNLKLLLKTLFILEAEKVRNNLQFEDLALRPESLCPSAKINPSLWKLTTFFPVLKIQKTSVDNEDHDGILNQDAS